MKIKVNTTRRPNGGGNIEEREENWLRIDGPSTFSSPALKQIIESFKRQVHNSNYSDRIRNYDIDPKTGRESFEWKQVSWYVSLNTPSEIMTFLMENRDLVLTYEDNALVFIEVF